jgi:hypothetical protein
MADPDPSEDWEGPITLPPNVANSDPEDDDYRDNDQSSDSDRMPRRRPDPRRRSNVSLLEREAGVLLRETSDFVGGNNHTGRAAPSSIGKRRRRSGAGDDGIAENNHPGAAEQGSPAKRRRRLADRPAAPDAGMVENNHPEAAEQGSAADRRRRRRHSGAGGVDTVENNHKRVAQRSNIRKPNPKSIVVAAAEGGIARGSHHSRATIAKRKSPAPSRAQSEDNKSNEGSDCDNAASGVNPSFSSSPLTHTPPDFSLSNSDNEEGSDRDNNSASGINPPAGSSSDESSPESLDSSTSSEDFAAKPKVQGKPRSSVSQPQSPIPSRSRVATPEPVATQPARSQSQSASPSPPAAISDTAPPMAARRRGDFLRGILFMPNPLRVC